MVKLIHGADFHLDSPFSGLSPERAARRRQELRKLPARLAQLARDRGADLVLLSGDLLDSERIYPETVRALKIALGEMPCPVFIAPGNHDCWSEKSVWAAPDWPEQVHIFRTPRMEGVPLPDWNCTVWGRAFCSPHQEDSPLAGFSAPADGELHLGCLHGDTAPQSPYGPLTPEDIARSGLTYLALGHIHQRTELQRAGNTFWAYPGCPEGRGFDETGEKGVLYVEAEPGAVSAQFVPLCRRRYERLTVDLTGQTDCLAAVRAALPPDAGAHIFRVLLTGEGERPDLTALEEALAPLCYGLTIRDHTRLPLDLWKRREEDSLTGLFLREMWALCEQDPDDPKLQLAARYGLAALEDREEGNLL